MPRIELRLFGHLRSYRPEADSSDAGMDVSAGTSVEEMIRELGVPPEDPKVVLVNGMHAALDRLLEEGDRVSIFPPVAGG
jgi:molybdopterin synthase sulfur carrier subunit